MMIISVICWAAGPVVFLQAHAFWALSPWLLIRWACVDFVLLICDLPAIPGVFAHLHAGFGAFYSIAAFGWRLGPGLLCHLPCLGIAVVRLCTRRLR